MLTIKKAPRILLSLILLLSLSLVACGPVTIDIASGSQEADGAGKAVASQTMFILLIVLLVAMFAMVFVAMSSR